MKKYIHYFVFAVILAGMALTLPFFNSCKELTEDVLRVHILANSDSASDQCLKLTIRDKVLQRCSSYYDGCNSKEEAIEITRAHLGEIEKIAEREILSRGFSYPVKAEVEEMYFNTRYYENFTMPAGNYDALRLTIGKGEGQNWWCVMYPSLCVGCACEDEMKERLDDGEYRVVTSDQLDFRFKLVEVFGDMKEWFR